ncbi:alpha-catulin [Schistocerca nitens]|uniref:alpha-catulin n=1 Tax=Schistocerca nitens TaxID=7011 RepID=UPI0021190EF4|nr:alpha-catulin [Schistocerca nitens]
MAAQKPIEQNNLEIKTKSIEQTLIPLVKQISTLVAHRERDRERPLCSERSVRAVARVGQAVNLAVERFVTVGETIADDNPDIKADMYDACKEARAAGAAIEKLCEAAVLEDSLADRGAVVRAARGLLASVTRVLLLADVVVVKQLLLAKDKVARSLGRLEGVTNFTEFVKAFSQFGAEMVELAHLTGDRQNDLKDERRRAQMAAARQVLERSTMMLLTSSKACLRHPDCPSARENRDTVFCQMRRAMDLIHYVVKDGVLDSAAQLARAGAAASGASPVGPPVPSEEDWDASRTVSGALKHFEDLVEMTRLTLLGPGCKERLTVALDAVVERTQDFTDSAYTSHEHRESILLLCDRAKLELNQLLRVGVSLEQCEGSSPTSEMESAVCGAIRAARDMGHQLRQTTLEQAAELPAALRGAHDTVAAIRNAALAADADRLQDCSDRFTECLDHILEVCKLLRHIAVTDTLQVSAKYTEINLRIYGPQVITAAHTLSLHPTSKIAKENLEVFADMWQALASDVQTVSKEIVEQCQGRQSGKQVYMSLPRPGKHGTTSKPLKPVRLDSEEQAKIAKTGLEMKLISSEMDAETDKWQESGSALEENNDIVKRAKNMSSMAFSMYQFTRGEGALKTTQDLFTQAEYFAEEANRLYKVVRQFSYQVPGGPHKKELLENLDKVPTYVQQLQFTVKNPTVGKAATFTKVDNVIQETKSLMDCISKVVTTCFVCATKYNLDFRGLSSRGTSGSPFRDEDGTGAGAGGEGGKMGGAPGSDPSI